MKSALALLLALQSGGGASRVLRSQSVKLASGNATVDLEDAAAISKVVEAEARLDFEDAAAIRRASAIASHKARAELEEAREDAEDGKAIAKADKLWSKAQIAKAHKELKDPKDRQALLKAVTIEAKEQDRDAAQMKLLSSKESANGEATERESLRMEADADIMEHEAMVKLEREGAAVKELRAAAAAEEGQGGTNATQQSCSSMVSSPSSALLKDIPNMVHGASVKLCGAGQLKKVEGSCPDGDAFDKAEGKLTSNAGASDCQEVKCDKTPCCMAFKCGASGSAWSR